MRRIVDFIHGTAIERAYAGAPRISLLRQERWTAFQARELQRIPVIAQMDEPPGIRSIDDIAAVPGLDAVFVGQIGLALA